MRREVVSRDGDLLGQVRVVHADGDPNARGQQIGRALRDLINESVDFYHRYLSRRGVSSTQLQEVLTPYVVAAEAQFPGHMTTIKGMSVGAMVPVLELFAINAFEELEPFLEPPEGDATFLRQKNGHHPSAPRSPKIERCSSFSVVAPGVTLLGHNEHWLSGDAGNVAVVIDLPDDGSVPVASPTIACCLPAVGMNGHRGAQGVDSLPSGGDRVGVPRVLVSRHTLEAMNGRDGAARAGHPFRAGGYGHVFAFAGGSALTVETTGRELAILDGPGPHTNHYVDPDLAKLGPPPSEGSLTRLARLARLLAELQPTTPEEVMVILRDHEPSSQAICQHPNPDDGDDASSVLFSMVADLEAGRMWVSAGNPCENEYEEIDLIGVL
ncbi:MAG: C45 family peptidase [Actinomycetota bacterium]